MKRSIKIGIILFVAGLVATLIGWRTNGFKPVTLDKQLKPTVVQPITIDKDFKKVKGINVDVINTEIQLRSGEQFHVTIHGNSTDQLKAVNNSDNLTISNQNGIGSSGFNFDDNLDSKVIITVPENARLTTVNLAGSGNIDISQLKAKNMIIKQGFGDSNISNSDLENIIVKTSSGDINLDETNITAGNITNENGDFEMNSGQVRKYLKVNNQNGNNEVTGVNFKGYKLITKNGKNEYNDVESERPLVKNENKQPFLQLLNNNGDNELMN